MEGGGAGRRALAVARVQSFKSVEFRGSNFCADGLCGIASANHATDCIAAASVASFDV